MRQVPGLDAAPFGIVGGGRVARHFQHYFALLGIPVHTWSRRTSPGAPLDALGPCRTILILIRDREIVPFVNAWPDLRSRTLVHFSGSLATELLAGAHPLMTFGDDLYDLDTYRRIPFVLDAGGAPFEELLPGLPNPSFTIPAGDRAYYHALCVMAGNFSTLLWRKLFDELKARWQIPPSAAHAFLAGTTTNLLGDAGRALTGPLSRGDVDTIDANLKALDGDSFQAIYRAFVRAYEERA